MRGEGATQAAGEGLSRGALELLRAAKDTTNEAAVLSELAGVLWSRQDYAGAKALVRESIDGLVEHVGNREHHRRVARRREHDLDHLQRCARQSKLRQPRLIDVAP